MKDSFIHETDPGFEDFIEKTMQGLAEQAQENGICPECLSDRLIVELVSGMVRSGAPVSAILSMVGDGIDGAYGDPDTEEKEGSRRMH
ncbi:hypothetical protein [Tateyamaria pelophila]|uniref:hypothetical protein n=1 Tax=Tateyamaria pelophila TaxID=328415 RepID=UPI001CBE8693|nr:hypothetical protein [Tateyamaria pelophila]